MLKTLCLGGSFNPIHHGHLICARAAAESANFDRVLLIPSSQPPHKTAGPEMAPAADRLAMTQIAVAGNSTFDVDGLEIDRTGPSYTVDTARLLKARGFQQVDWLIGADLLPQMATWHQPESLFAEVNFWVIQRPGNPIDWLSLPPPLRALEERLIVAPLVAVSATDIRRRIAMKQPIDFLTPPVVITYIREHGLYGSKEIAGV